MQISETTQGGAIIVAPAGRIDSTTSPALDAHLLGLAKAGTQRLVVDFTGVDYISSAGLRVMLSLAKRTKETQGRLVLTGLGDSVKQVFALAGFLPLFVVEPSADAAVARVTGS